MSERLATWKDRIEVIANRDLVSPFLRALPDLRSWQFFPRLARQRESWFRSLLPNPASSMFLNHEFKTQRTYPNDFAA
jgi:hypothetical protein